MNMPKIVGRMIVALALLLTTACQTTEMDLPESFLRLDREPSYPGFRATTPDEARLQVRTFGVADAGDLAFWDEALRHEFAEYRGYNEEGEPRRLTNADGEEGIGRVWFSKETGRDRGYLVVLFVEVEEGFRDSHSEVTVLEFSARVERFRELLPEVLESVGTLDY
ncbi:MAG: hypothetical protein AAF196_10110 [Planctomycetota bacterium]